MARAIPVLPVDNLQSAREFYIDRLGFCVTFDTSDGGATGLIGIARDGIAITLDCPMDGHGRHVCVTIEVDDVDEYFAEWNKRVTATRPPRDESWGARTFDLQDPFGNTLFVMGPITTSAPLLVPRAAIDGARYGHTNLIAHHWQTLSRFYERVFGCLPVPPARHQQGDWLDRGTGVPDAHLEGVHLRLPGHGADGPTLEIYTYSEVVAQSTPVANRAGYGHLAFQVDDVRHAVDAVIDAGGSLVGEIVSTTVSGRGHIEFAYTRDPEGNIIELQRWS